MYSLLLYTIFSIQHTLHDFAMSHRARRMRQQTMVWAWLLLLAFVPQLVMKATHFHHAPTSALTLDAPTSHCTHATPNTSSAKGTHWVAHTPADAGQACASHCDLCHYTPLWSVAPQALAMPYDATIAARPQPLPWSYALARGVVCANALRGPPAA